MLPLVICRHYDVEWLDARTCYCSHCGRQGHWTEEGYAIWIHTERRGIVGHAPHATRHVAQHTAMDACRSA